MTSLADQTVLVTGANGGLGREFVSQALERGAARVYASARRPGEWDDERIVPLPLDVTDSASIASAAEAASDVTVVISNAGVARFGPLLQTTDDELRAMLEVNVVGSLAVARAFAPVIEANGGGVLMDVASAASWRARAGLGAYAATKAALWSITDSLRFELKPLGIRVVGLYLAMSDTPMTTAWDVEKTAPSEVVRQAYDGIEDDVFEVLADQATRDIRARLSGPLEGMYPSLAR